MSNFNTIKENNQNGIDANFFTNHDSPRAAGFMRRDEKLIKFAWGMNMMTFGNAFLYYGEELGMSGSGKDENKRAPMLWSKTDKTGMTNGPLAMEKQENSFEGVDIQLKDENSILNYVKHAVYLRNSLPSLSR
ncbi:MAG: alpha-amylase family glycosyl hydrolase, partial [Oscillospiraceae bacterium]